MLVNAEVALGAGNFTGSATNRRLREQEKDWWWSVGSFDIG